jgi:translation elongation factor EF-Ts
MLSNLRSRGSRQITMAFLRQMSTTQFASPALVKQLRAMTGSGIKDCMKALNETEGDIEASKDYLRKKGLAEAEKKVDRLAA